MSNVDANGRVLSDLASYASDKPYPFPSVKIDDSVAVWRWSKAKGVYITEHMVIGHILELNKVVIKSDAMHKPQSGSPNLIAVWYDREGFFVPAHYLRVDGSLRAQFADIPRKEH